MGLLDYFINRKNRVSDTIELPISDLGSYVYLLPYELNCQIARNVAKEIKTIIIETKIYEKFLFDRKNVQKKEKYLNVGKPILSAVRMTSQDDEKPFITEVSATTHLGNLNFDGKFEAAIEIGHKLLEENPNACMVHISLMMSYFKLRNQAPDYLEYSSYHAKQAIINGHNTGYAHERLVINLEKSGKIYQAIQLCDLVLLDDYNFSSHGCGRKEDFLARKEKLLKKINKAIDTSNDRLFSDEELSTAIDTMKIGVFEVYVP